jgi:hypothetical protein
VLALSREIESVLQRLMLHVRDLGATWTTYKIHKQENGQKKPKIRAKDKNPVNIKLL